MREVFHGQLQQLGSELTGMCERSAAAMREATRALLRTDFDLAEQVTAEDAAQDRARDTCEQHAHLLLALHSPVATDLRTILAALYCAVKLERMGDLAAHIAEIARSRHPDPVVPPELEPAVRRMGELDVAMAEKLAGLVQGGEGGFDELHRIDDAVDELRTEVLDAVRGPGWRHGIRMATDAALLARFYERFADQAVSVARRLEFATTGTLPRGRH